MRKTLMAMVLGAAVVAGGAALAPAAVAQPAVSCYGAGCNGKDPARAGCNADAKTVGTGSSWEGVVYLRYSPSCHANWARIDGVPTFANPTIWVQNKLGNKVQYTLPLLAPSGWSDMVNGYPLAEAGDGSANTGWH